MSNDEIRIRLKRMMDALSRLSDQQQQEMVDAVYGMKDQFQDAKVRHLELQYFLACRTPQLPRPSRN